MKSIFMDLRGILFSPKSFFQNRFVQLSSKQIFVLGFLGTLFGLLVGSAFLASLSHVLLQEFAKNPEPYLAAIKSLSLSNEGFAELVRTQQAYCFLIIILSPILSYIAPHLFGGALFIFLWSLVKPENSKLDFFKIMDCASISLTSMAFYCVPLIGPILSAIMVFVNVSRALKAQYKIVGFMKVMAILTAMYICFLLASTSLQLLAVPLAGVLK